MNAAIQTTDQGFAIEAALARAGLAAAAAGRAPLLLARGTPWRIVWANDAAAAAFGTGDLPALTRTLLTGPEPAARQLARQADRMVPGLAVADLRLRLRVAGRFRMMTLSCRRLEGDAPFFAIAPWGYQAAVQPEAEKSAPAAAMRRGEMPRQAHTSHPLTDRRGNVRFLWRTDRSGELTNITGALCEAVGCDPECLIGRDFRISISELNLDPDGRLRAALSGQDTWSGIEVLWPVAGAAKAVPVIFGGLPCFDRARAFDGFSGFGVIHLDRMAAAPQIVADDGRAESATATLADEIRAENAGSEEAATAAAAADEAELAAPSAETAPQTDADLSDLEAWGETSSLAEEGAREETEEKSPDLPAAPEQPSRLHADNVVPLRAWQREPRAPLTVTEAPQFGPSEGEVGTTARRSDGKSSPQNDTLTGLSQAERNAFREIARALGARSGERQITNDNGATEAATPASAPREGSGDGPDSLKTALPAVETVQEAAASAAPASFAPETPAQETPAQEAPAQETPAKEAFAEAQAAAESSPVDRLEGAAPPPSSESGDLSRLLDRLESGVLVSRGGVPAYVNRTLLDMLGYASIDDFHESGGVERMFRGRDPGALSRDADGGAIPVIAANGDVLALEVRMQSSEWDGEPASLMTFRRTSGPELTARIRALELDLRQREAEARETHAILDTATDGVVLVDEDGRILTLNKSAQALFGYEQNEVAGEPFTMLLARESHAPAMDYLGGLKSNGVKSVLNDGREVAGRASRGGAIPLFMTLGRVGVATPQRFCAVLRDLTQWKKVERELGDAKRDAERASQLKSDFLAKVSHEIRTPLNAILGFAEVIMDERFGPVGNERYKDYLKDIHASGAHVLSLVNDLLDLSKIEAGKLDLNFGAVDANRIVNECVSLIQTQATRERVIIRLSLAPRLPNVVADERSLRQIVLNILSNAVKFNEPGGQVIVSTALTDAGHAVIRIRDTGIGMNEKELETALEPFRQIATSRQTAGTGLGLPLTKALVEANRASFTIKSRKGEGTLVEVAFPQTRVLAE